MDALVTSMVLENETEASTPGQGVGGSQPCLPEYVVTGIKNNVDLSVFIITVPFMLVITVLGFIGNSLSYVVLSREMKPSSTSVLLKGLAIADNCLLIGYCMIIPLYWFHKFTGYLMWYLEFENIVRRYLRTFVPYAKDLSVYLTVAVTMERYIAVCKPLKAAQWCTVKNARIICTVLCLFFTVYNFPFFWYYKTHYLYDPCYDRVLPWAYSSDFNMDYYLYWEIVYTIFLEFNLMHMVPMITMTFTTYKLILTLKEGAAAHAHEKRDKEVNTITVRVVTVVIIYIILEIPNLAYRITVLLFNQTMIPVFHGWPFLHVYYLREVIKVCGSVNSFINFYVYCLTGKRFRQNLYNLFKCKGKGPD